MGIGDWGLGIGPNPQSPIPNPHINFFVNQMITFKKNKFIYFIYKNKNINENP